MLCMHDCIHEHRLLNPPAMTDCITLGTGQSAAARAAHIPISPATVSISKWTDDPDELGIVFQLETMSLMPQQQCRLESVCESHRRLVLRGAGTMYRASVRKRREQHQQMRNA